MRQVMIGFGLALVFVVLISKRKGGTVESCGARAAVPPAAQQPSQVPYPRQSIAQGWWKVLETAVAAAVGAVVKVLLG